MIICSPTCCNRFVSRGFLPVRVRRRNRPGLGWSSPGSAGLLLWKHSQAFLCPKRTWPNAEMTWHVYVHLVSCLKKGQKTERRKKQMWKGMENKKGWMEGIRENDRKVGRKKAETGLCVYLISAVWLIHGLLWVCVQAEMGEYRGEGLPQLHCALWTRSLCHPGAHSLDLSHTDTF